MNQGANYHQSRQPDKSALPGPRWLAQRIGYGAYLTSAALLCMGGPRGASGKECIQGV
ncbi:hypothetical protein [uncultured Ottowia sp.]|uniref:hypothetical protein n=1 Tax=uncultured Ottowia sp. TaxID=543067 RepID=UPI0025997A94|nr:hypothetical protein [uncultured Ottowia sp.]